MLATSCSAKHGDGQLAWFWQAGTAALQRAAELGLQPILWPSSQHPAVHVLPRAAGGLDFDGSSVLVLLALGGVKALHSEGEQAGGAKQERSQCLAQHHAESPEQQQQQQQQRQEA